MSDVKIQEVLRGGIELLTDAGVPNAANDARLLAAHLLDCSPLEVSLLHDLAPQRFLADFALLLSRRAKQEPLQHILGIAPFRYLELKTRRGVFIPRPETEVVAQVAIDEAKELASSGQVPIVIDACTGSGAIALSLATEVPQARVFAFDLSPVALDLVRENAAILGAQYDFSLTSFLADVTSFDADTRLQIPAQVDVFVSNPPYIPPDQEPLEIEVRDYDPDLALYGGGFDGLLVPRKVIELAAQLLVPGGLFVMEHAEVQADAVCEIAAEHFVDVQTRSDLTQAPRMVVARKPVS